MSRPRWTKEPLRFFQHLLRETDAIGLDPARLVEEIERMGANAYIVMGGGFSAWYPTKLASQTVNPHLQADFLGEFLIAARAAGIRVLIRMDISKGRQGTEARHPDWFVRKPDGSVGSVWAMPQICATGPFWQQENFSILEELLSDYPADGFFYNYYYVPRCYCPRCQELVRATTGTGVPAPGVRSPVYERWRQQTLAKYTERLRDFIHARNPEAALVPYHHVRDGWDSIGMAMASDMIGGQVSNPLMPNPIDPQPMWNHFAAEEALRAKALKPEVAPVLIQSSSEFFASRQTALPAGRLIHHMALAAAHGGSTAPAINGLLAQDDPRFLRPLEAFRRFQVRNDEWYRGLRSLAKVAILRSDASVQWGNDGGRLAGNPVQPGHVAEFRGLYEAISARRYPCDIVMAGALDVEALRRYTLILLPDVSCLGDVDAAVLNAYVADGGRLLATGAMGAADAAGVRRDTAPMAALPALPGLARDASGAYLSIADANLRAALGGIPHIGVAGEFWTPELAGAVKADLRLIGPFENNAPEFTVVEGAGTTPGLLTRRHGRGEARWLPWRIGALYHRYGIPEYAILLGHLLDDAVGPPPIITDAPAAVDFTLYAHPRGLVLHALNGASVQGRPLSETAPLAGFALHVATDATQAHSLVTGSNLPARRERDRLRVDIERLAAFEAIALT